MGAAWVFSKEKFFTKHLAWLSFGKLRASYGTTGNDQIQDYQYMDLWQPLQYAYDGSSGIAPVRIVNPAYSWERTRKLDLAIEGGFLQDKLHLLVDYYQGKTDNQLVGLPLPPSTGSSSVQANFAAVVENKGWELELTSTNLKNSQWSWITAFNMSIPSNKLSSYPGIESTSYATLYTVGKPLTLLKAYHYKNVDPATGIYQFEDANKDGMLSYPEDLQSIKSIAQKYYGGIENRIRYKGFEFSMFIQFVKQTGLTYLGAFRPAGFMANQPTSVLGRWQHAGDITDVQKFTQAFGLTYQGYVNSVYYGDNRIGDASYLRLRNVALSWNVPTAALKKIHIQQLKFYIQANNIWTKTNYQGMDPENQNAYSLPSLKMLAAGFQLNL